MFEVHSEQVHGTHSPQITVCRIRTYSQPKDRNFRPIPTFNETGKSAKLTIRLGGGASRDVVKNRIKDLRVAREMSMEDLGRLIGAESSTVSKIEKDQIGLDPWIDSIAAALGVSRALLLEDIKVGFPALPTEDEAAPFVPPKDSPLAKLVEPLRELWEVKTDGLSEIGIRKNSFVLLDTSPKEIASVREGDQVIATVSTDGPPPRELALLRQLVEPHLLTTNSASENAMPVHVRTAGARIKGRIIHHISSPRR